MRPLPSLCEPFCPKYTFYQPIDLITHVPRSIRLLYLRLLYLVRHLQALCETLYVNGTLCQPIDLANTCTKQQIPASIVPTTSCASPIRAIVGQRHSLSAHRPRQHLYQAALLLCLRLAFLHQLCLGPHVQALFVTFCPKCNICQPIDLANTCTKQHCYFACVYCALFLMCRPNTSPCVPKASSVSPSTSPTHVPSSITTVLVSSL